MSIERFHCEDSESTLVCYSKHLWTDLSVLTVLDTCPCHVIIAAEYSDNEVHDGGLDGAFEGAFDNYTGDLHDNLVAMVTDPKTFHGVEPMGK